MTLADELPIHPHTGLQAVGLLRNGAPIWPVLGGSGEGDEDDATSDAETEDDAKSDADEDGSDDSAAEDGSADGQDDKADDDKPLGPAGEKALAAEKEKRKQAADRARAEKARADAAEAELAKLRRAADRAKAKTAKPEEKPAEVEQDIDPEEIRRDAEQAAEAKANERIVKAEVRASAAGKLNDPKDALKFLDLTKFEVDADGNVDSDEIDDAIADLVKNKPYLAVAQGGSKRFKGSGDGGAKPAKPARPKSLGDAVARHYTK